MPSPSGFGTAGLTTVLLPSGYRVRGVVPGLDILATRGLLDGRVLASAMRLADKKILREAEPDAQERDLRIYVDALVAGFAQEALDPGADPETGEWKPTNLTVSDLGTMDQRDRGLLEDLVWHVRTAEEVTAASEAAIRAVDIEEAPGEIDRLAEFRVDPGSSEGGDDGAGMVDAPLVAVADGR